MDMIKQELSLTVDVAATPGLSSTCGRRETTERHADGDKTWRKGQEIHFSECLLHAWHLPQKTFYNSHSQFMKPALLFPFRGGN